MTGYRILGPLEVEHQGGLVALGGPKQRAVLAMLLADSPRVVTVDRLLQAVWGDGGTVDGLQVNIAKLRRALDPGGLAQPSGVIETVRPGYRIRIAPGELDLQVFLDRVEEGRRLVRLGEYRGAVEAFRSGLLLWRGTFAADVGSVEVLADEALRLDLLRVTATAECLESELQLGRHVECLPELELLVSAHPLDEHLRALQMLALYRSGRQSDALASYREIQRTLLDDLGVQPGPELETLELRILNHDPGLALLSTGHADAETTMRRLPDPAPMASLVTGEEVVLLRTAVTTIGRLGNSGLVVSDPDVSRRHAEIRRVDGGHRLVDVGSTNGTFVGGEQITECKLQFGDLITVGSTEIRYEMFRDPGRS